MCFQNFEPHHEIQWWAYWQYSHESDQNMVLNLVFLHSGVRKSFQMLCELYQNATFLI